MSYEDLKYSDLKDLSYEVFNLVAIHPISGKRYPFGQTKEIDRAPIIASNKTVIPPNLVTKVALWKIMEMGF